MKTLQWQWFKAVGFCTVMGSWVTAETQEEKLALADSPAPENAVVAENPQTDPPPTALKADRVRDPRLRKHIIDNIDVFGKNEMPAIYILTPGVEEYEGFLLTRDFSRDEFFMQNIDREEFEMKTYLRDFDEEKKKRDEEKH